MAEFPEIQISTRWTPDGVVVSAVGEIDPLRAPVLRATLDALAGAGHREVVLDLAAVTFLDASCLGAIAAAALRLDAIDGIFAVRAPRPMARRLLTLADLEGFIESSDRDVATFRSSRSPSARPVGDLDARRAERALRSAPAEHADQIATRVSGFVAAAGVAIAHEPALRPLDALESRAVISQAQGVLMARFGVAADTAFIALRRSSEARGTPIGQRAGEIVALTLREDLIGDVRI